MEMGERVWNAVMGWNYFAKDTVGKQLVRAIDSVASNLSEGFGRYHYREAINFGYYSRGSLYETRTWLTKAHSRGLISGELFDQFMQDIDDIGIKLNNYIKSIGKQKRPPNDRETNKALNDN
jgi:four helix bundle protein